MFILGDELEMTIALKHTRIQGKVESKNSTDQNESHISKIDHNGHRGPLENMQQGGRLGPPDATSGVHHQAELYVQQNANHRWSNQLCDNLYDFELTDNIENISFEEVCRLYPAEYFSVIAFVIVWPSYMSSRMPIFDGSRKAPAQSVRK